MNCQVWEFLPSVLSCFFFFFQGNSCVDEMGFLLVKPAFFEVDGMALNDSRCVLFCVISHMRLIMRLFGSGVDF